MSIYYLACCDWPVTSATSIKPFAQLTIIPIHVLPFSCSNSLIFYFKRKQAAEMERPPNLLAKASYFRPGFRCSLANEAPSHGCSHTVYKIIFEDSVQWAARVCHDPSDWPYELRATEMFQHVKQECPDIRAPNIHFEAECPILYSEWVGGKALATWNSQIPLVKRQRFLDDLAEFLVQLWTTPPLDSAVRPKTPYSVWLTESLNRGLRRTLAGTARWGDAIDYLIMRSMILSHAIECDKYIGFAHGDLNAHNIMIDDDFHLTG